MYIGVVHRDSLEELSKEHIAIESTIIEDYIASERTFKFAYFNDEIDVFILEKESVFSALQDIKIMYMKQEEYCLGRERESLTMEELDLLRIYIQRVATDVNFYWKDYCIGVLLDAELEMLDI